MNEPEPPVHMCKIDFVGCFYLVDFGWPISFNRYKNNRGYTSKAGREWRDCVVDQIWSKLGAGHMSWQQPEPLIGRVGIWWELWRPDDRRSRDLDNYTGKHCLDALVKAGLMEDDSEVVEEHKYRRGPWHKGRVLVTIAEV